MSPVVSPPTTTNQAGYTTSLSSGSKAPNLPTGSLTTENMYSMANSIRSARDSNMYSEWLSDTAHQREVADFRAAGINPVLTANRSGASTFTPAVGGGGGGGGSDEDSMSESQNKVKSTLLGALVDFGTGHSARGISEIKKVFKEEAFQRGVDDLSDAALGVRPFDSEPDADSPEPLSGLPDGFSSGISNMFGVSSEGRTILHAYYKWLFGESSSRIGRASAAVLSPMVPVNGLYKAGRWVSNWFRNR